MPVSFAPVAPANPDTKELRLALVCYGGVALVSDLENHSNDLNLAYTVNNGSPVSLTQSLLPRRSGGRIPAAELLMVGYGARQHIRKNALQHLHQEITITRKVGSFTLEESLAQLVAQRELTREEAMVRSIHPEDLDTQLKAKGL